MRRYYLGCILSLMTVLVSSQVNYHFTIDPQSVSITQNNGYSIINVDGMDNYMNEVGKPQIPYITKRFVIPKNARVTEVRISNMVQQKLDGNFLIYPSQAPILVNRMEDDIADGFVSPDPTVYTSNQSYPEDCYKKCLMRSILGIEL